MYLIYEDILCRPAEFLTDLLRVLVVVNRPDRELSRYQHLCQSAATAALPSGGASPAVNGSVQSFAYFAVGGSFLIRR